MMTFHSILPFKEAEEDFQKNKGETAQEIQEIIKSTHMNRKGECQGYAYL